MVLHTLTIAMPTQRRSLMAPFASLIVILLLGAVRADITPQHMRALLSTSALACSHTQLAHVLTANVLMLVMFFFSVLA